MRNIVLRVGCKIALDSNIGSLQLYLISYSEVQDSKRIYCLNDGNNSPKYSAPMFCIFHPYKDYLKHKILSFQS